MGKTGRAFFVERPRIWDDLFAPHDINTEHNFEIVAEVKLGATDFGNFVTDMLADRQFIEEHCDLCLLGRVWKCLFVRQKGRPDGVLVIPADRCHVKYAAYYLSSRL